MKTVYMAQEEENDGSRYWVTYASLNEAQKYVDHGKYIWEAKLKPIGMAKKVLVNKRKKP